VQRLSIFPHSRPSQRTRPRAHAMDPTGETLQKQLRNDAQTPTSIAMPRDPSSPAGKPGSNDQDSLISDNVITAPSSAESTVAAEATPPAATEPTVAAEATQPTATEPTVAAEATQPTATEPTVAAEATQPTATEPTVAAEATQPTATEPTVAAEATQPTASAHAQLERSSPVAFDTEHPSFMPTALVPLPSAPAPEAVPATPAHLVSHVHATTPEGSGGHRRDPSVHPMASKSKERPTRRPRPPAEQLPTDARELCASFETRGACHACHHCLAMPTTAHVHCPHALRAHTADFPLLSPLSCATVAGCLRCTLGIINKSGERHQPCMWCTSPESTSRCVPFIDPAEGNGLCMPPLTKPDDAQPPLPVAARDKCPMQRPVLPQVAVLNTTLPMGQAPVLNTTVPIGASASGALSLGAVVGPSSGGTLVLGLGIGTACLFLLLCCCLVGCFVRPSKAKRRGSSKGFLDDDCSDIEAEG